MIPDRSDNQQLLNESHNGGALKVWRELYIPWKDLTGKRLTLEEATWTYLHWENYVEYFQGRFGPYQPTRKS